MPLIDLTQLDQEQRWAIAWGRQQANDSMKWEVDNAIATNARLTEENEKLLPEHQKPLVTVPAYYTDQTWADKEVWNWVGQQLTSFQNRIKQNVEVKIAALSLEERLQLMASLQVEPVLRSE
jgi:hypothetical protein